MGVFVCVVGRQFRANCYHQWPSAEHVHYLCSVHCAPREGVVCTHKSQMVWRGCSDVRRVDSCSNVIAFVFSLPDVIGMLGVVARLCSLLVAACACSRFRIDLVVIAPVPFNLISYPISYIT